MFEKKKQKKKTYNMSPRRKVHSTRFSESVWPSDGPHCPLAYSQNTQFIRSVNGTDLVARALVPMI